MGIPEREEREKGAESIFKNIIAKNFPNLGQNWIHKSMKLILYYLNTKRSSSRHIILKLSKVNN